MDKTIDCVVCGTCVVDVLVDPVPLSEAIGGGADFRVKPLQAVPGGLVANAGTAMARLGLKVAAFTLVGDDHWAEVLRRCFAEEGIDTSELGVHPSLPTSTTAVLVDESHEHAFAHCGGAARFMDAKRYFEHLDLFARSRMALVGYYSMLPELEPDLPEILQAIAETGCKTAMDSACGGGTMEPLGKLLPHLDVYFPSLTEAVNQTGAEDPRKMVEIYRNAGARGIVGVKLGEQGALISPEPGRFVSVEACPPPGPVVDTVGAGDAFFGGLIAGMLRGHSPEDAARLGAATGACCVSGSGATEGLRDLDFTAELAGLKSIAG